MCVYTRARLYVYVSVYVCVYVWRGCMRAYVFVHMYVCVSGGVHKYYRLIAVQHHLHASSKKHSVTKCSHTTQNTVTLNRPKITHTWSIYFQIVSKILGYGWKKTNSNCVMIRLKVFASQHPLSTRPCNTHRQALSYRC